MCHRGKSQFVLHALTKLHIRVNMTTDIAAVDNMISTPLIQKAAHSHLLLTAFCLVANVALSRHCYFPAEHRGLFSPSTSTAAATTLFTLPTRTGCSID